MVEASPQEIVDRPQSFTLTAKIKGEGWHMMKTPSKERGCTGKANLGRNYRAQADKLSAKHGKAYGVYQCPHCGGTHLTTKLGKRGSYPELLHVSIAPRATTSDKTDILSQ